MPIQLQEHTKTKYFRHYYDDNGFQANIIMNPRDAMVFATVLTLPKYQHDYVSTIKQFVDIVKNQYGAKACINIAPDLLARLPEGTLAEENARGRYINSRSIDTAILKIANKEKVKAQLKKFDEGEYRFLTKAELKHRAAELAEFKILYSSFASEAKIKTGQYSDIAEKDKLENPFTEHYAIANKNSHIIACGMHVIYDNGKRIYDADFVIHPDYRNHGLAQAFWVKMHQQINKQYPHVQDLWFIAGGHGGKAVGDHLYNDVLPTIPIPGNVALQKKVGVFLTFVDPGREFLLAANRDPDGKNDGYPVNENERVAVDKALQQLAQSLEPNLAAKQPGEPKAVLATVSPISIFKQTGTDAEVPSIKQTNARDAEVPHIRKMSH